MSYDLSSFSEEFFLGEGEPYDRPDLCANDDGRPTSVWSAILVWHDEHPDEWRAMAANQWDLQGSDAELLMGEAVLDRIRQTNTCTNIAGATIEVWIDRSGWNRLKVWR